MAGKTPHPAEVHNLQQHKKK